MIGMQFLAQPLDKFSGGISDVGHQSVARSLHPDGIINLCAIGASPLRKQSAIIEKTHHQSRGVAQPGSAPALGAGGRRFKSYRPDQSIPLTTKHYEIRPTSTCTGAWVLLGSNKRFNCDDTRSTARRRSTGTDIT